MGGLPLPQHTKKMSDTRTKKQKPAKAWYRHHKTARARGTCKPGTQRASNINRKVLQQKYVPLKSYTQAYSTKTHFVYKKNEQSQQCTPGENCAKRNGEAGSSTLLNSGGSESPTDAMRRPKRNAQTSRTAVPNETATAPNRQPPGNNDRCESSPSSCQLTPRLLTAPMFPINADLRHTETKTMIPTNAGTRQYWI